MFALILKLTIEQKKKKKWKNGFHECTLAVLYVYMIETTHAGIAFSQ